MAIGDDARAAGYEIVPDNGEEGKVRWGAREINNTRDMVARVAKLVLAVWPITRGGTGATTKHAARNNLGITSGSAVPSNADGENNDIYIRWI